MFQVHDFLQNGFIFPLRTSGANDPDSILVGWGEWQESETILNHGSEICAIYAPDFYMTDLKPWLQPKAFEVMSREKFADSVLPKLPSEVKDFRWQEPSREGFEKQASRLRQLFASGRLEKAVPVVHAQALEIMTQDRLAAAVVAAVLAPPSLMPYGFWRTDGKKTEGLLGATPERLFAIEGGRLVTMALAGTRAKTSPEDAKRLFEDPKERREHQIVVDDLIRELSKWGEVQLGETFVTELPTLVHLKTTLTVTLKAHVDFEALARALHPTPALGLSPRSFGFQNMREWDDVALRARFGAPFGLRLKTARGKAMYDVQDCLVAIRNIQWRDSQSPTLGSGCGFVSESVEEREWQELKLKRDAVKKVLKL